MYLAINDNLISIPGTPHTATRYGGEWVVSWLPGSALQGGGLSKEQRDFGYVAGVPDQPGRLDARRALAGNRRRCGGTGTYRTGSRVALRSCPTGRLSSAILAGRQ